MTALNRAIVSDTCVQRREAFSLLSICKSTAGGMMIFPRISERRSGSDGIWPEKVSTSTSLFALSKGGMNLTSFSPSFEMECLTKLDFFYKIISLRGKSWGWHGESSVFQWKENNGWTRSLPSYKLNTDMLKANCIIFPCFVVCFSPNR